VNLRKDHSHTSTSFTVNLSCEYLRGDGDSVDAPAQELEGGRAWLGVGASF